MIKFSLMLAVFAFVCNAEAQKVKYKQFILKYYQPPNLEIQEPKNCTSLIVETNYYGNFEKKNTRLYHGFKYVDAKVLTGFKYLEGMEPEENAYHQEFSFKIDKNSIREELTRTGVTKDGVKSYIYSMNFIVNIESYYKLYDQNGELVHEASKTFVEPKTFRTSDKAKFPGLSRSDELSQRFLSEKALRDVILDNRKEIYQYLINDVEKEYIKKVKWSVNSRFHFTKRRALNYYCRFKFKKGKGLELLTAQEKLKETLDIISDTVKAKYHYNWDVPDVQSNIKELKAISKKYMDELQEPDAVLGLKFNFILYHLLTNEFQKSLDIIEYFKTNPYYKGKMMYPRKALEDMEKMILRYKSGYEFQQSLKVE